MNYISTRGRAPVLTFEQAMLTGLAREEGLAALVATHDLELAGRLDRVLRIEDGRIVDV